MKNVGYRTVMLLFSLGTDSLRRPYAPDLKTEFMVWPLAFAVKTRYETLSSTLEEFYMCNR